jgi:PAS domain S-box-containing protein
MTPTKQQIKIIKARKWLARITACTALVITSAGFYANWRADQRHLLELEMATELERAEAAIRESLDFGHVVVNHKGEIVGFNPAMVKWTGLEDAVGRKLTDIVPEEMRETHLKAFTKAIEDARKPKTDKTRRKNQVIVVHCELPNVDTGKRTPVRIGVYVTRVNDGEPFVVAKVARQRDVVDINPAAKTETAAK